MHRAIMAQGHAIITQKLYHNLGDFYKVLLVRVRVSPART